MAIPILEMDVWVTALQSRLAGCVVEVVLPLQIHALCVQLGTIKMTQQTLQPELPDEETVLKWEQRNVMTETQTIQMVAKETEQRSKLDMSEVVVAFQLLIHEHSDLLAIIKMTQQIQLCECQSEAMDLKWEQKSETTATPTMEMDVWVTDLELKLVGCVQVVQPLLLTLVPNAHLASIKMIRQILLFECLSVVMG